VNAQLVQQTSDADGLPSRQRFHQRNADQRGKGGSVALRRQYSGGIKAKVLQKIGRELGVGSGTVQRVLRPFEVSESV
jgi:hypothetical protein